VSVQNIIAYPDPVLRCQSEPVTEFGDPLQHLIENLTETLYSTPGIGLCAPQLGRSTRVVVMDLSAGQSELELYINPVIVKKAGLAIAEEACLSIPGVTAKVMRSSHIQIQAQRSDGEGFEKELTGMQAICLQHEIDHLNGILFFDRISLIRRLRFRRALQALEADMAQQPVSAAST